MKGLNPEDTFERNFEKAWESVYAANDAHDEMTAAQTEFDNLESEGSYNKRVINLARQSLKGAKIKFGLKKTTAGYYVQLEGEGNPLLAGNITKRPEMGTEPYEHEARATKLPKTYYDPAQSRFREGLGGIRAFHLSTPRARARVKRNRVGNKKSSV